jgi:hypothetical protein
MDLSIAERLANAEETTVLTNHLNTPATRNRRNTARNAVAEEKRIATSEARQQLEQIQDGLAAAKETTRQLKQQAKELKERTGVSQTNRRGEKRVCRVSEEEMAGLVATPVQEDELTDTRPDPAPVWYDHEPAGPSVTPAPAPEQLSLWDELYDGTWTSFLQDSTQI